jgi:transcriptional pleiotropic repressor
MSRDSVGKGNRTLQSLLERFRRVNRLLQKTGAQPVQFREMAAALAEVLGAPVYVLSRKGKILGGASLHGEPVEEGQVPQAWNDELLHRPQTEGLDSMDPEAVRLFGFQEATVVPVVGGGERLGTLLIGRAADTLTDEDVVLAETGATVVGMEILRAKADEIEDEARAKAAVQIALGTLSYSEMQAVRHIFEELDGTEGLLVASKIADRVGITRSVIVNALRKFESAGVIEARSLGMKGTYIRVLNDHLLEELQRRAH